MLSVQNMLKTDNELVHAARRAAPRKTSSLRWVYTGAGVAAGGAAGAYLATRPRVRKALRRVVTKIKSRVRIIRRAGAVKVSRRGPGKFVPAYKKRGMKISAVRRRSRLVPDALPTKRGVLGYKVHVRKTNATAGLGYNKYYGTWGHIPRSLRGSKARRISTARRAPYRRSR